MKHEPTGAKIDRLIANSDGPFVAVAPFVTRPALLRLLDRLGDRPLSVITDWRPDAVAAGATDPRIIHDIRRREGRTALKLLPGLHAKLFWTTEASLVGSTNLTSRGTGWFGVGNLELLVQVGSEDEDVRAFLSLLRDYAFTPTEADADAALLAAQDVASSTAVPAESAPPTPLLRTTAHEFFHAYMMTAAGEHPPDKVFSDMEALSVPRGLDQEQLVHHLRTRLRASPYYALATHISTRTVRDADVTRQEAELAAAARVFGLEAPEDEDDARAAWQRLMSWMVSLLPDNFQAHAPGRPYLVSGAGAF